MAALEVWLLIIAEVSVVVAAVILVTIALAALAQ